MGNGRRRTEQFDGRIVKNTAKAIELKPEASSLARFRTQHPWMRNAFDPRDWIANCARTACRLNALTPVR
jgi:hypothetical protein